MKPTDEPRFSKALDALSSLFSRELDEPAVALYWMAVADLTIEQFEKAVQLASGQCAHFPPPVALIALVDVDPPAKIKALEAWPEALRLAKRSRGDHSDPIAAKAIRLMGGGKQLGQRPLDELEKWGKKEFVELYESVATQPPENFDALPPGMPSNLLGMG